MTVDSTNPIVNSLIYMREHPVSQDYTLQKCASDIKSTVRLLNEAGVTLPVQVEISEVGTIGVTPFSALGRKTGVSVELAGYETHVIVEDEDTWRTCSLEPERLESIREILTTVRAVGGVALDHA